MLSRKLNENFMQKPLKMKGLRIFVKKLILTDKNLYKYLIQRMLLFLFREANLQLSSK